MIRLAAALAAAVVVLVGCGGGADEPTRPVLDEIAPAVAAVEAELGGPQQFFEINATPQVVNLFVATDDATTATAFIYVGGALGPAAPPAPASGGTFDAAALTFDPDTMLDGVADDLPDSQIVLFTIAGNEAGDVEYTAGVQSAEGGSLTIVLGPDGAVQSVVADS